MSANPDMSSTRAVLETALDYCDQIDNTDVPDRGERKDRVAAQAEIQRLLLFLSHLCDKARIDTLDQYHAFRGFTDHLPNEERDDTGHLHNRR